jgi:predicted RNase H-like HicB family nuclease
MAPKLTSAPVHSSVPSKNEIAERVMLTVELEQEVDGRWIGEVPELSGVLVYAATPVEAQTKAMALAFRVIADRLLWGEPTPAY